MPAKAPRNAVPPCRTPFGPTIEKGPLPTELPTILTVGQSLPQERLDIFLRAKFPAVSRGAIQRLLAEGRIQVNGRAGKPTHHPRAGETISIRWPVARPDRAQAEDIPLDILYEDDDLLVVNKPPWLVVHPAAGHPEHTVVNALLHHC